MIVYEVELEIDIGIAAQYRAWLDEHVAQILALPGFTGVRILDVLEPAPVPAQVVLCVQYALTDADALAAYLRDHAPRLRAEGAARFGDGFRARRRILRDTAAG